MKQKTLSFFIMTILSSATAMPALAQTTGSLGISVPSNYKGYITSTEEFQSQPTKFFKKYVVEQRDDDKAIQFLNAGAIALPVWQYGNKFVVYTLIDQKNIKVLDAVHEHFPQVFRYSQALHHACATGNNEMVDYLIQKGASLDLNGKLVSYEGYSSWKFVYEWNEDRRYAFTPIDCALFYGQRKTAEYIMEKYKKNPTPEGVCYAVLEAIKKGNNNAYIDWLISLPAFTPNPPSRVDYMVESTGKIQSNLLCAAIDKSNKELAKKLIEMGADVNYKKRDHNKIFDNPLLNAVKLSNMQDLIELLLSKGAKTIIKDDTWYVNVVKKARSEYQEWFILNGYQ